MVFPPGCGYPCGVRKQGMLTRLAAVALAGVLLSLCFPGANLGALVWVWMLPLFWALWTLPAGKGQGRRGLLLGWVAGAVFFAITFRWLWAVSGLGALVVAGILGGYFGLWGMYAATWGNPWRREAGDASGWRSLRIALGNAALWAGLEWLRGWLFTGFSWNGLGVAFHDQLVLAQGADLLGVAGLAFVPVFVSGVAVQALARVAHVRSARELARVDMLAAAVLVVVLVSYGAWRLDGVRRLAVVVVRVLLIQRNIPQSVKWQPQSAEDIYRGYAQATQDALDALDKQSGGMGVPDLVIWPETALPERLWFIAGEGYPPDQWNAGFIEQEILSQGDFTFITGVNEFEGQRVSQDFWDAKHGGEAYNSMAFFRGNFASGRSYRKVHRVPFGEYIPLRRQIPVFESLFKFSAGVEYGGDFSAGKSLEPVPVEVAGTQVGVIPAICFEDTVNRLVRRFVRPGPQMIVNVTNDGWFLQSVAAEQHLSNALFRSIETRRPMVRAANTGVSCVIDATGSWIDRRTGAPRAILDSNGRPFIEGTMAAEVEVPTNPPTTLYAIAGDSLVIALGLAGLLAGWLGRRC